MLVVPQRVRKLKKKQQREREREESERKRARQLLEADEPRDDGGGGGKRSKTKTPSDAAARVKNPKQREPSAADIAKAQAAMPVIKLSQVRWSEASVSCASSQPRSAPYMRITLL